MVKSTKELPQALTKPAKASSKTENAPTPTRNGNTNEPKSSKGGKLRVKSTVGCVIKSLILRD